MARDAGVTPFVFASSCSIYGVSEDAVATEDVACAPSAPYAESKWLAEKGLENSHPMRLHRDQPTLRDGMRDERSPTSRPRTQRLRRFGDRLDESRFSATARHGVL